MNTRSLQTLIIGALLALSCSKEESFEKRKADTDNKGPLLVKVIMQPVGVSYTMVATLDYDNHKRLVNTKNEIEGEVGEPYAEEETVYYRNAAGMIERIVGIVNIYDENDDLQERDSVALNLNFTADGRYTYGLRTVVFSSNSQVIDSIAYSYNDKGRIALIDVFRKNTYGSEYEREQTTGYGYDEKGNVSTMTISFADNGQDPPQVIGFQYNDKLSPMNFGDEALLNGFAFEGFNSPHCLTGIRDLSDPDTSWEMSYEYNDFNKPAKGVYNNTLTQEKTNITYFYQ